METIWQRDVFLFLENFELNKKKIVEEELVESSHHYFVEHEK